MNGVNHSGVEHGIKGREWMDGHGIWNGMVVDDTEWKNEWNGQWKEMDWKTQMDKWMVEGNGIKMEANQPDPQLNELYHVRDLIAKD